MFIKYVAKNPRKSNNTIDPLGGMSIIYEIIIPAIIAITELTEEMIRVCLNDFERLRLIKVGITMRADTNRIPTALILMTTIIATRIVNKTFARFTFFLDNNASSSLNVKWSISL